MRTVFRNHFTASCSSKKKLGVATFVMRQKEHLSLLGVYKNALVLHVTRFQDEIRDPALLELPADKVSKREVAMAISLIDQYTETFEFTKFKDIYNDQLIKIIDNKSSGKTVKREEFKDQPTLADNLMAKLKASLEKRKAG